MIVEAVSLFPSTFRFQNVYDLLNIEKVHSCLFQESMESLQSDEQIDLTANRENARLHLDKLKENLKGKKAAELKNICYKALKELMKLIM